MKLSNFHKGIRKNGNLKSTASLKAKKLLRRLFNGAKGLEKK